MFSDRIYQIALLVSLLTHGIILFRASNFNTLTVNKNQQKMEISYIKTNPILSSTQRTKLAARETLQRLIPKITVESKVPSPFMGKDNIYKGITKDVLSDSALIKPAIMKPDIIAIKKKIVLPAIDTDKINNPSYLSYYQIVREKIRRAAYQNYSRTETGEVYLTFIIAKDGSLKQMRLVEEKSSPRAYLREIALRSIKEASPFPAFPKELDYPQLSFNVVISFEIEQ